MSKTKIINKGVQGSEGDIAPKRQRKSRIVPEVQSMKLKSGLKGSGRLERSEDGSGRLTLPVQVSVLTEARRSGLLSGEKTEHVSFRAPPALLEAAKRETGVSSTSELGILALATLAQPDPVAAFMKRTRGRLGKDHQLDH